MSVTLRPWTPRATVFYKSASSYSTTKPWRPLPTLPDYTLPTFREQAFEQCTPALLPRGSFLNLPAIRKWFTHDHGHYFLDRSYLDSFGDASVPLEYTDGSTSFQRTIAPLSIFLNWTSIVTTQDRARFYLAQAPLSGLPRPLQDDLPLPEIVLKAGKGDIYDANLWIGIAPTYTPLHRDPNPNLFVQLAGSKIVRLMDPGAGDRLFEDVQKELGRNDNKIFRGESMMEGKEKNLLKKTVWSTEDENGREAYLGPGDAVFVPRGWWHSIKGVHEGVTGSVNWWFR